MNNLLIKQIIAEIEQNGPMSFVRFMQQALYSPGLGYYSSGLQPFGKSGDFITAPELSPLFSRCIAQQCQQILKNIQTPIILELGAGSGAMAVDILLMLEQWNVLPNSYWILELSAELQLRQKKLFEEKASHLLSKIKWLSRWPSQTFEGIVLANEVLDAMPVYKFRWENNLQEAYVDYQKDDFCWYWDKPNEHLSTGFQQLNLNLSPGYGSEWNGWIDGWIKSLSQCLSRGVVLCMDYGFPRHEYYHPERSMGTLMCHYQHRAHSDPLILVGLQDITAHVDFTSVAEAAMHHGFDVEGYTNQAAFLLDCGITELLSEAHDDVQRLNWNNQVKLLTLPSEMGELFKVIALSKNWDEELLGFKTLNLLERL